MSASEKSPESKSLLSTQNLVIAGVVWSILALLFFLLFSVPQPGEEERLWYEVGTTIFELGAYLAASLLCFRNWRSPQIVSGRTVWLAIGLGMLFYLIGGILFFYWETVLQLAADVSPGDIFYVLTYLCLGWGLISAVFSRRLTLEIWQWGVVAGIAAVGIVIGALVSSPPAEAYSPTPMAIVAQAPTNRPTQASPAKPPARQPATRPAAKPAAKPAPVAKPAPAATTPPAAQPATPVVAPSPATPPEEPESNAPQWAKDLQGQLEPLKTGVNLFYIISDVVLLIMATILLLAFWGGRSSLSWRMIAAAAFSLYIADIWFKYATTNIKDYRSGSLPEVFWIFSGVLFALGAALEYDLSTRSRRTGRRRSAS
ncbi:MAG: hypothetical protein SFW36_04860 [Leptolyngbyaceae cyanobacterium bins.59]|nr:hypothetical protein [Leptolyngbyaceae cyanobacterium bins.59]